MNLIMKSELILKVPEQKENIKNRKNMNST